MSVEGNNHWGEIVLENAVEALIDYRGKTPKKTSFGIPLITAKIVKNGRIEEPSEFIAVEDYDSWMVRGLPQIGDVVVTTEAPLGEVAQLLDSKVALAQRIVTLRGKKNLLDNDFLLYLMQSHYIQDQLEARASGSTVRGIKQSELRKITLLIPPLSEQIWIAKQIKVLDKKIELNRVINQTLEAMAQAIFQSWFVDFDPVKAKIAAREQWQILTDDERTEWLNELLDTQDYFKTCLLELTAKAGLNDDENVQLDSSLDLISCRGHGPESSENLDIGFNNLRKEWQSKKVGPALQSASETLYLNIAAMTAISSRNETSLADMPADEFAQLYKTASLFPERLVESELGEIPEGWRISCVDDICHFQNGYAFKSKEMSKSPSDSYKVFKMGHIKKGGGLNQSGTKDYFEKKKSDKLDRYLIKKGDLLMCMTDMKNNVALLGHTALMDVTDEYVLNQRVGLLRSKNTKIANYSFLYILTNSECFIEDLRSRANSGVQVNLSTKEIKETKFILPSEGVHIAFDRVVERGQETKFSIEAEQQYLAELRDTLLPKLLSGELDVMSPTELSDIDQAVMDV